MTTIADGKVAAVHFTLTLADGEVADSSHGQQPLLYLHGHNNIVPGLESELTGKAVGDQFQVKVPPAEGFGERDERGVQELKRSDFPPEIDFEVGMDFGFEGEDGEVRPGWVTEFTDDTVTIDLNHPLAGETLTFDIEVLEIRDASAEEMEHGHPHGPGGHEH